MCISDRRAHGVKTRLTFREPRPFGRAESGSRRSPAPRLGLGRRGPGPAPQLTDRFGEECVDVARQKGKARKSDDGAG